MAEEHARDVAELRPLLFAIAYRMLGSVSDAEDVVQEAFLRHHRAVADGTQIESAKAYLSAVTTRLAIDHLRSARVRRETYVGNWLPEPVVTDADPATEAAQADSLSMAFLLVLERLTPVERAVFLLHDVFDYDFAEIAGIVDKSVENCRQIAVRARKHVGQQRPRFAASPAERDRLADRFLAAFTQGDVQELVDLLAADVVMTGDGGGMRGAWPRPILGREKVSRLLAVLAAQLQAAGDIRLERAVVNGQPGVLFRDGDGALINVMCFEIGDGSVQAIRSVISREKLQHLVPEWGPLADVEALRAAILGREP